LLISPYDDGPIINNVGVADKPISFKVYVLETQTRRQPELGKELTCDRWYKEQ